MLKFAKICKLKNCKLVGFGEFATKQRKKSTWEETFKRIAELILPSIQIHEERSQKRENVRKYCGKLRKLWRIFLFAEIFTKKLRLSTPSKWNCSVPQGGQTPAGCSARRPRSSPHCCCTLRTLPGGTPRMPWNAGPPAPSAVEARRLMRCVSSLHRTLVRVLASTTWTLGVLTRFV